MLTTRRARHDLVSAWLAAGGDDELSVLLGATPTGAVGVGGGSSVLDVDGVPVVAKQGDAPGEMVGDHGVRGARAGQRRPG